MTTIERRTRKRNYPEYRTRSEAEELLLKAYQEPDTFVACRQTQRGSGVTYINPQRYLDLGHNLAPYLNSVIDQIQHSQTAEVVRKRVENGRVIFS